MSFINIVMYHYVRPIQNSQFPMIKGLELEGFKRQLDYLSSKYLIISAEDVIDAVINGKILPAESCWLTFDDGYKDHFSYVLPELLKRNIQGSFFPPVKPIIERVMLDVNSIHHIIASTSNINDLVESLFTECRNFGISEDELNTLWLNYAVESRYDAKEIIFVKRLLQHALSESIRNEITANLFHKFVGFNQTDFANQLYMSELEVKELVDSGMYVGSHGYRHLWLNKVDKFVLKSEIDKSLSFLSLIGARTKDWIMCYPYGAFNDETITQLDEAKCAVGITTEVAKADLQLNHRLKMPRFDTNDFPQ
jgi:peptidoglycan/xylan/chitin deacetylase (PgdA/CDA1 family)